MKAGTYYEANREKCLESARLWRHQNPEKAREATARWRKNNPAKARAKDRRHKARYPERERERLRAKSRRRRAAKRGASGVTEQIRHRDIAERDGWRCHLCGKRVTEQNWSLDHLVPLAAGGEHARVNVALAHLSCNAARGAGRIPAQLLLIG